MGYSSPIPPEQGTVDDKHIGFATFLSQGREGRHPLPSQAPFSGIQESPELSIAAIPEAIENQGMAEKRASNELVSPRSSASGPHALGHTNLSLCFFCFLVCG